MRLRKGEVRGETMTTTTRKRRDDTTTTKVEETRRTDAPPVCNEVNHNISWFVFIFFALPEPSITTLTTHRQHLAPIDNE